MFYTLLPVLATDKTFTSKFELLGGKVLLHNILPKFDACRFQLINLNFVNASLIRSEVFKDFQGLFNNSQSFGVFCILYWNKGSAALVDVFLVLST